MKIPEHIFCQCMKPWKICVNKKNSYKTNKNLPKCNGC